MSKTFMDLSSDTVHNRSPSELVAMPTTFPKWARKCFTNSIPVSCFFQNLTCPSMLAVIRKSVLNTGGEGEELDNRTGGVGRGLTAALLTEDNTVEHPNNVVW